MKKGLLFVDDERMVLSGLRRLTLPLREKWRRARSRSLWPDSAIVAIAIDSLESAAICAQAGESARCSADLGAVYRAPNSGTGE